MVRRAVSVCDPELLLDSLKQLLGLGLTEECFVTANADLALIKVGSQAGSHIVNLVVSRAFSFVHESH